MLYCPHCQPCRESRPLWKRLLDRLMQLTSATGRHARRIGERPRTRKWILSLMLLLLTSCQTISLQNSQRLMARDDFGQAVDAVPEWCRDALKTINQLEERIEAQ